MGTLWVPSVVSLIFPKEVIKFGLGMDFDTLGRGMDIEYLMGIPMEDKAIIGELYTQGGRDSHA
jgi:hypothetical protein